MYSINHHTHLKNNVDFIEISNKNKSSYAKIYLNDGASLQELILNGHILIKDMDPLTYNNTYASAILFPFANRVKDGTYLFNGKTYQLEINEKGLNNAIHGLVYNKTFELLEEKVTEASASVTLIYNEKEISKGFPFTYSIKLEYILTLSSLELKIEIVNTDVNDFPFTIGWHPYFLSDNLYNSLLRFDSHKKAILNERNITQSIDFIPPIKDFEIKDQLLDDCFVLNSNEVKFTTPKYIFNLKSSEKNSFLQIYTPPHNNTIAIEPTTGVSDSYNNGIGLKKLKSNEKYNISWHLMLNEK